jgi:hypothetical protein
MSAVKNPWLGEIKKTGTASMAFAMLKNALSQTGELMSTNHTITTINSRSSFRFAS